jgi:hypothetical protein
MPEKIRYFLKGKNKGIEGIIYTDKPFYTQTVKSVNSEIAQTSLKSQPLQEALNVGGKYYEII